MAKPRLVNPPIGLPVTSIEPLAGPRSIGAGSTESTQGFAQTFASPLGGWAFQFSFAAMEGDLFKDFSGWVIEMHGGANVTRWDFNDPDVMSFEAGGQFPSNDDLLFGVSWSNGEPWEVEAQDPWFNTGNWDVSHSVVSLAAPAALDATEIRLSSQFWGHRLKRGEKIGFFPFHFGMYSVNPIPGNPGAYRIWPPLRKALTVDDFATLKPSMALKLPSTDAAPLGRGLTHAEGLTITFLEVLDYDVRDYFEG